MVDNLLPRFIAQHLYGSLHCRFHKQQITGLQDQYTFIKVEGMPFLGRVERNIPLHILAESKQNEPFLLFFIRFFTDGLFRLSRIEFPIPCKQENRLIVDDKGEVAEAPCFEYDEEAWSLRPIQLMEDRLGVKKLTLASSNSVSHNLSDVGTCFSESNTFEIRNRKWYLKKKNV